MSQDSTIKFKDFEYEFGMFTKLTWNGEVIYDEETALDNEITKVTELYADRVVYEMKVNVVSFHHVELDIIGETVEHAKLVSEAEKEFKEISNYINEMKWDVYNIGCILQTDLKEKFELNSSLDYYTPCLDFILSIDGTISITPYITAHTEVLPDKEDPIFQEAIVAQQMCYEYALKEANKIKDKFKHVIIEPEV